MKIRSINSVCAVGTLAAIVAASWSARCAYPSNHTRIAAERDAANRAAQLSQLPAPSQPGPIIERRVIADVRDAVEGRLDPPDGSRITEYLKARQDVFPVPPPTVGEFWGGFARGGRSCGTARFLYGPSEPTAEEMSFVQTLEDTPLYGCYVSNNVDIGGPLAFCRFVRKYTGSDAVGIPLGANWQKALGGTPTEVLLEFPIEVSTIDAVPREKTPELARPVSAKRGDRVLAVVEREQLPIGGCGQTLQVTDGQFDLTACSDRMRCQERIETAYHAVVRRVLTGPPFNAYEIRGRHLMKNELEFRRADEASVILNGRLLELTNYEAALWFADTGVQLSNGWRKTFSERGPAKTLVNIRVKATVMVKENPNPNTKYRDTSDADLRPYEAALARVQFVQSVCTAANGRLSDGKCVMQ